MLDGDVNDLRCFSDEQTKTNVEAFIEQIAEGRARTIDISPYRLELARAMRLQRLDIYKAG